MLDGYVLWLFTSGIDSQLFRTKTPRPQPRRPGSSLETTAEGVRARAFDGAASRGLNVQHRSPLIGACAFSLPRPLIGRAEGVGRSSRLRVRVVDLLKAKQSRKEQFVHCPLAEREGSPPDGEHNAQ